MEEKFITENGFPFFRIIYKNLVLIVIITVLCGIVGSTLGVLFSKPVYTKKCDIMLRVNVGYGSVNVSNNTSIAKDYLPTVAGIIKSPATIELAKEIEGEDKVDNGIKRSNLSVNYSEDSLIFTISYSDATPELAESRLKKVVAATNVMLNEDNLIAVRSIELIELQSNYSETVSDRLSYYILISWIAGVIVSFGVVIMKFLLDNKIKTTVELEHLTDLEVLACIDE